MSNVSYKCQGVGKLNKLVVRRLPPHFTLEIFKEHVSLLPPHNYIYCVKGRNEDCPYSFSRVYINFIHHADVYAFKEKYDNYVFIGLRGTEYNAVVEFAPYQEVPNTRLFQGNNILCGTICSDIYYQQFLNKIKSDGRDCWENSEYNLQINYVPSLNSTTPLLKFVTSRKAELKGRTDRKNINSLVFVNSYVKKSAGSKRRS